MIRTLTRPLTRPLTRALTRPALDSDAAAYIAALVVGGATVSSVQSGAIDTFIRAEKAGGRWDLIKRLYLPIWGLVAPNAICMRSLTSGTFVGDVTHGAGKIEGDGSSGYFAPDSGAAVGTLGMANGNCHLMTLFLAHASETKFCGFRDDGQNRFRWQVGTSRRLYLPSFGDFLSITSTTGLGVFVGSMNASDERHVYWRDSVGFNDDVSTINLPQEIPNLVPYALASNDNGSSIDSYSAGTIGAFGFGLKLSNAAASAYTANLKTLWEDCTGLSLPA